MNTSSIQAILSRLSTKVSESIKEIQSSTFKEKYGELAKKLFGYSKRVLTLEGIVDPENKPTPTKTDELLARSIAKDVAGGGWEGNGQAIMKMFSIFLGRNLEAKNLGLVTRIVLPKGTIIKTNKGDTGMISEQGNLMVLRNGSFSKDTNFNKYNTEVSLATEDEIVIFMGTILESQTLTRSFSSAFKVSTPEEITSMVEVSINGMEAEQADQIEYKKYMANLNPELTQGYVA